MNRLKDEPKYVKLYLTSVPYLLGAEITKKDFSVLFAILKILQGDNNEVVLISNTKKRIAKEIGINVNNPMTKVMGL